MKTTTKLLRNLTAASLACTLALVPHLGAQEAPGGDDRPVIRNVQRKDIKVVVQITSGDMADGVSKGLKKLDRMFTAYVKEGIEPEHIHLHAVIHGAAAEHVLSDAAWNHYKKTTGGNPSSALIAKLAGQGVKVELCDSRRQRNGWKKSDVHADVLLAGNAYHRLADLQFQGFVYVRQ